MTVTPRAPHLITLILMAGLSVASLNMIVPAFGEMAERFEVTYATINFMFSGYLILVGFLTLIAGPLSDRYGRRPVALTGIALFTVASLVCAVAPNLQVLFTARVAQSVVVAGAVIGQAVVRDTSPDTREATFRLSSIAMIMGIAPLIGPSIGGLLADLFSWRAVFVFQTGAGLLAFWVVFWDLTETNLNRSSTFMAQVRAYPSLLSSIRFWGYGLMLAFGVSTFFAFLAGMPLIGRAHYGLSQTQIGMVLGLLTAGYIVANAITRQIARRYRGSTLMVGGRLVGVLGAVIALVLISSGSTNALIILPPLILLGAANGFSLQAANAGVVSVNTQLSGSAAGLSGALICWFGSSAAAVMSYALQENPSPTFFIWILFAVSFLALLPALLVAWLDRKRDATVTAQA